jgi:hypothetical protein
MRPIRLAVFALLLASVAWGEILPWPFEPKEFDEARYRILVYDWMERLPVKELSSQSYDYAFAAKDPGFEVRYILFAQTKPTENHKLAVRGWALAVGLNIAGSPDAFKGTSEFKDEDVKGEFNADYGLTSFAYGGGSDFTAGRKYAMVNFYYKKDLGLMCQVFLFDDTATIRTERFLAAFHAFRFT